MLDFLAGSCLLCAAMLCVIDCALTVLPRFLGRRCSSGICTTAGNAAHASRSSRAIFFLAVMCCLCVVFLEARSNKVGTRTHEERTARPSNQQNFYGARAMSFAWLMLVGLQMCSWSVPACLSSRVAGV